ncbi:MAG TPA: RNA polymerase sigma factor [Ignavibacteria bacterium]|nr:RNA polymerase sigma factor [Ignavibacteria bacterium]
MKNPLSEKYQDHREDNILIQKIRKGDNKSLEILIKKHQGYIYNIALRMVFNPEDAEDITQEVLIKVISNLAGFEGKSNFRTWLYRIAVNHILNWKKSSAEKTHTNSFSIYSDIIDGVPDMDIPDNNPYTVETKILIKETQFSCMMGMLLCLDRDQRMVYILGSMFGVSDNTGAEILEISKDNFRQKLSRARKDLYSFMHNKCSLVNNTNPCKCNKKTKHLIDVGYVNPQKLLFNRNYYYTIEQSVEKRMEEFGELADEICDSYFREQPFQESPDFTDYLRKLFQTDKFKNIFNYN